MWSWKCLGDITADVLAAFLVWWDFFFSVKFQTLYFFTFFFCLLPAVRMIRKVSRFAIYLITERFSMLLTLHYLNSNLKVHYLYLNFKKNSSRTCTLMNSWAFFQDLMLVYQFVVRSATVTLNPERCFQKFIGIVWFW